MLDVETSELTATLISFEYSAGFGYLVLNFDQDILDSLDPRGLELRGNGDESDNSALNVYTLTLFTMI